MALRSGLSLLAVAAIVGGAAFYVSTMPDKTKEVSSEEAQAADTTAIPADAQQTDATTPQQEPPLNTLAPAAGEEKSPDAENSVVKKEEAPSKADAPKKSAEEVLKTQNLQIAYGQPDAPVTVIEYFSLSCPHCGAFFKDAKPKLMKDYVEPGKVYYIMRYFPHNAPALAATMLMQCVENDKQQEFINALFNMQDTWAFTEEFKNKLMSIAQVGGIGPTSFIKCLENKEMEDHILTQRQEALDSLGLEGIPTFFVNGKKMDGTGYGTLVETIEKELKASAE